MKKQVRNRYSSAGITAREANTINGAVDKIMKISEKNNLYVGYQRKLVEAAKLLWEVLQESDRV